MSPVSGKEEDLLMQKQTREALQKEALAQPRPRAPCWDSQKKPEPESLLNPLHQGDQVLPATLYPGQSTKDVLTKLFYLTGPQSRHLPTTWNEYIQCVLPLPENGQLVTRRSTGGQAPSPLHLQSLKELAGTRHLWAGDDERGMYVSSTPRTAEEERKATGLIPWKRLSRCVDTQMFGVDLRTQHLLLGDSNLHHFTTLFPVWATSDKKQLNEASRFQKLTPPEFRERTALISISGAVLQDLVSLLLWDMDNHLHQHGTSTAATPFLQQVFPEGCSITALRTALANPSHPSPFQHVKTVTLVHGVNDVSAALYKGEAGRPRGPPRDRLAREGALLRLTHEFYSRKTSNGSFWEIPNILCSIFPNASITLVLMTPHPVLQESHKEVWNIISGAYQSMMASLSTQGQYPARVHRNFKVIPFHHPEDHHWFKVLHNEQEEQQRRATREKLIQLHKDHRINPSSSYPDDKGRKDFRQCLSEARHLVGRGEYTPLQGREAGKLKRLNGKERLRLLLASLIAAPHKAAAKTWKEAFPDVWQASS